MIHVLLYDRPSLGGSFLSRAPNTAAFQIHPRQISICSSNAWVLRNNYRPRPQAPVCLNILALEVTLCPPRGVKWTILNLVCSLVDIRGFTFQPWAVSATALQP